jgi:hypothetical protein
MDEAIAGKIEENKQLSAQGKEYYKLSIPPYMEGIAITAAEVAPEAKECFEWTKTQIEEAPMLEKVKVKKTADIILYLAPKVGPDLQRVASTGKKYVTYAMNNGVKVPKNATKVLDDL